MSEDARSRCAVFDEADEQRARARSAELTDD